jgi:hypothetical protein
MRMRWRGWQDKEGDTMTNRKDKIRRVAEQFGTWGFVGDESDKMEVSFERDGLEITGGGVYDLEAVVSDRFNVTYQGELVYQNVFWKNMKDPNACIYKPGEWEQKLDELYVLAEKDLAERIEKKLKPFRHFWEDND